MIGRRTFITLVGGVTARSHRGRPGRIPYVERLIGTVRRECLDHVLIFGERHLRRILALYSSYYNQTRTHLALGKDAPLRRAVQGSGTTDMIFGKDNQEAVWGLYQVDLIGS